MASTLEILKRLTAQHVEYVLVGGMAAVAHGAPTMTVDVDVAISFDLETLGRVARALDGLHPVQRMHPARAAMPDAASLVGYRNLYLSTDAGVLDLLGSVTGVGDFEHLKRHALPLDLGGVSCLVMSLEDLLASKKAMGRPKDLAVAAHLEAVLKRLHRG